MGCPISTIDELLDSIDTKHKDWCLVLLLDRDRHMSASAASQMLELLSDFDEDSGDIFDFYLPGYSTEPVVRDGDGIRRMYWGQTLASVNVARIDRLGDLSFSRHDFRTFYKLLERLSPTRWRWSGGCELLLFRRDTNAREVADLPHKSRRPRPLKIVDFCSYNLEDIACNGYHMQQFVRQLCNILEEVNSSADAIDWVTVKRTVDDVYYGMIMPRDGVTLSADQLKMRFVGRQFLEQRFPCQSYVFISHSTKDVEFALAVRDELESRGVRCWMAPRDIPGGTNYAYMISGALGNCGILLFLLSLNSMSSVWCAKEMLYRFADLQKEGRIYVAWCRRQVPLLEDFDFTLTDVQIDGCRDVQQIAHNIIVKFFGEGLANARATDTSGWVKALHDDMALLSSRAFVENCPWDRFSGDDWIGVLTDCYELYKKIRFDLLSAEDSAKIILKFPALADRCDWNRIVEGFPWGQAKRHPELIQYFPKETAGASAWVNLLRACPDFPDVNWGNLNDLFSDSDWVKLIVAQPELAGKFQHWDRLSGADWNFLLSRRPEIASHCDAVDGWSSLSETDWIHVIKHVPEFASKRQGMCKNRIHQSV